MADFFTGLAKRTLGLEASVKPLIASSFVPGSALRSESTLDEAWATRPPGTTELSNNLEETGESQLFESPPDNSGMASTSHGPNPSIPTVDLLPLEGDVPVQKPVERAHERPPRASPEITPFPLASASLSATSEGIQPPIQQTSNEFSQEDFQDAQFGNRQRLGHKLLSKANSPISQSPPISFPLEHSGDSADYPSDSARRKSPLTASSAEAGTISSQKSDVGSPPDTSKRTDSSRTSSVADTGTIQQQNTEPLPPQGSLRPSISPLDISFAQAEAVQPQNSLSLSPAVTQSNPESAAPLPHLPLVPSPSSSPTDATLPGLSAFYSGRVEPTLESIGPVFQSDTTEPWHPQSFYVPGALADAALWNLAPTEPLTLPSTQQSPADGIVYRQIATPPVSFAPSLALENQSNVSQSIIPDPPALPRVLDVSIPSLDFGDAGSGATPVPKTFAPSQPMTSADDSMVTPQDFSEAVTLPLVRSPMGQAHQRGSPLESTAESTKPGAPEAGMIQRRVTGNQPSLPTESRLPDPQVKAQPATRLKSEDFHTPSISPLDISPAQAETVQPQNSLSLSPALTQSSSPAVTQSNPESAAPLPHLPLVPSPPSSPTDATLPGLSAHYSGRVEPTLESIAPVFQPGETELWQLQSSPVPAALADTELWQLTTREPLTIPGTQPSPEVGIVQRQIATLPVSFAPSFALENQANVSQSIISDSPALPRVLDVSIPSLDFGDAGSGATLVPKTFAPSQPMTSADDSMVTPQDFSEAVTLPLVRSPALPSIMSGPQYAPEPITAPRELASPVADSLDREAIDQGLTQTAWLSSQMRVNTSDQPGRSWPQPLSRLTTSQSDSVSAAVPSRQQGSTASEIPPNLAEADLTVPAFMTVQGLRDRSGGIVAATRSVTSRQYLTVDGEKPVVMGGIEPRMESVRATQGEGQSLPARFELDRFRPRQGSQSESPPTIQVRIGRVDVRRVSPPVESLPSPTSVQPHPSLSLSEYLRQREGGEL